ncbi:MAG TPA: hypothetical protein VHD36_21435 [Pirellulales bacterium]|nr:hypothetical protein [Pirellulales bacterium]
MSARHVRILLLVASALPVFTASGCMWPLATASGPMWQFPWPVPVSPYYQKKHEDKFWVHERYERVPILGPVTGPDEPVALDPPSPDEVMRALEKIHPVSGNVPLLYEKQRNNVRMTIEKIADYTDPPRFYPLIGPAQHHHCHYKCTVYYSDTTRCGYPVPTTTVDEDAREVIYIDHNHLHMVGNVDDKDIGIP